MTEKTSPGGKARSAPFTITRVIDAPRELVWKAYTEADRLKHWWGPKGFKVTHCAIDLRPGGTFHYGLKAPDGLMVWGKWIFREIQAPERFTCTFSFSDEAGGITRHPMAPGWPVHMLSTTSFKAVGNRTEITIVVEALEATAEEQALFDASHDSMNGGYSGTMEQLADYLRSAAPC